MQTIAPGCALDVERGPDCLFVRVQNLDGPASETHPLAEHLWQVLQQHFTYRLVLELNGIRSLSRRLVDQLVELQQRIEQHDGMLRLCGLSPHNRKMLLTHPAGDRLLPYEDREEAIMGRPHAVKPR